MDDKKKLELPLIILKSSFFCVPSFLRAWKRLQPSTEGPLHYPDGPVAPRRRSLNAPPKENKSTPTDITCSYSKGLNN